MKKILFVPATVVVLTFALAAVTASAADKKEVAKPKAASVEEQMDSLVKQGPGVHNIKKDSKGRVQSLIVVGQARISTVFGAAEGKLRARKKAEQSAKAALVQWFKDNVEVYENNENQGTVFMQGEEGGDKDARNEAGKKVEKDSDSYKSAAAGIVRGLQLLHADMNGEEKTCTLVYGWSLANSKAAKDAATNDPGIDDKPPAAAEPGEKKPSRSDKSGKKIRSEKATSKEAEDFLK
jgi:hypothetical protein